MLLRVLVAVDRPELETALAAAVNGPDVKVVLLDAGSDLAVALRQGEFDMVLAARSRFPEDPRASVGQICSLPEAPGLIVFEEAHDEVDRARLHASGCMAVLAKDLPVDVLRPSVQALLERQRAEGETRTVIARSSDVSSIDDFVSDSDSMKNFAGLARKVARSHTAVLILGETGVGKGRLAQALHNESPRSRGPFVPLHCAAIPEGLFESELFGHVAGAFTGASRSHRGYFELAHGGTLFLDEVGEIPPHIQVKLLRALEGGKVRRVGDETTTEVDVRVIAATNRDLERESAEGRFRDDLFYRLAVVTLLIPPLRERGSDIEKLVMSYLEHFRQQVGRPEIEIDEDAVEMLKQHSWPGNVRELINAIERAVLLCSDNRITVEDLPRRIVTAHVAAAAPGRILGGDDPQAELAGLLAQPLTKARAELVASFERTYVTRLMEQTGGRVGEAADRAGVNQRHLYEVMKRLGIKKETFR